jgi:Cu/Ag efflux protein CusF
MKLRSAFPTVTVTAAVILCGALLLPATLPNSAAAQTKLTNVVPESEAVTIHAKITAMDTGKRQVTLTVGPAVRLEMLKVGDTVNAQYYRSVAFVVSQPGATVPDDEIQQAVARPVEAPGGIGARVTQISGLVVGIDLSANRVDVVNPKGGQVYTVHVTNPERQAKLPMLKVGDTITAVVSEELAVSIQPAPKSLF